jgi:hypothetical protein
MSIGKSELLEFIQGHRRAVAATHALDGAPQAALISFVIDEQLQLFFDSFGSSRKVANLRRDPRLALVVGGHWPGDDRTVQYEGTADSPAGLELERLKNLYLAAHPDGRERSQLPGITYFRVRPRWIRFTNFNTRPAEIVQFEGEFLEAQAASEVEERAANPYTPADRPWRPHLESPRVLHGFAGTQSLPEEGDAG